PIVENGLRQTVQNDVRQLQHHAPRKNEFRLSAETAGTGCFILQPSDAPEYRATSQTVYSYHEHTDYQKSCARSRRLARPASPAQPRARCPPSRAKSSTHR